MERNIYKGQQQWDCQRRRCQGHGFRLLSIFQNGYKDEEQESNVKKDPRIMIRWIYKSLKTLADMVLGIRFVISH